MGRLAVVLDPAGYSYCEEPGFHFTITGDQILSRLSVKKDRYTQSKLRVYSPPESDWMLPRPLQFDPDWQRNTLLEDYVLRQSQWTFATGAHVTEFEPTRQPNGVTNPDNQWISAHIPEDATSLDGTSYTDMGEAIGVDLPAGMITVAFTNTTPAGHNLSEQDYAPHWQWVDYPSADSCFAFGFGDFCLVSYGHAAYLLQSPDNDRKKWKLLGSWSSHALSSAFLRPNAENAYASSFVPILAVRANIRTAMALPVGWERLYLHFGQGEAVPVKVRTVTAENRFDRTFKPGPWWIGAVPGKNLIFQSQIVGFDIPDSPTPTGDRFLFDLGTNYKPSVEPELDVEYRLAVSDVASVEKSVDEDGYTVLASTDTGQSIRYALLDESGAVWTSDGTHNAASIRIDLAASSPGEFRPYLAPQFRRLTVRFPPSLADRPCTPLRLTDDQFYRCGGETSLREPLGKRIFVDLYDLGAERIAESLATRDWYPIEIREDVAGDGTYSTIRAAGWIDQPELTVFHERHRVTGKPIQLYRLQGRGLLCRADQDFEFIPQLVDPLGEGYIEHTFAVAEALTLSGILTGDAGWYVAAPDPLTGTDVARLPGTWKLENGVQGQRVDSPWAPDWSETRIAYAERIAKEFRAWRIYEESGRLIRYHPDLHVDCLLGRPYFRSATLYPTTAAAVSAGRPGQVYRSMAVRRSIPPEANVIQVTGKDDETSLLPHVIERSQASIGELGTENFIGERRVKHLSPKLAVNAGVMKQICRAALLLYGQRQVTWSVETGLAPWQFQPGPLDVGRVAELSGLGDWLTIHCQWEAIKSGPTHSLFETRLTLERLPASASAAATVGAYPGQGAAEA